MPLPRGRTRTRLDLVASYRERVQSGAYVVDAEAVAQAMLKKLDQWIDLKPACRQPCARCEGRSGRFRMAGSAYCRRCAGILRRAKVKARKAGQQ